MSNLEPPRLDPRSEPLFTIQVSKRAGWLIAFAILCGVAALFLPRSRGSQPVQQTMQQPVVSPAPSDNEQVATAAVPASEPAKVQAQPVINHTKNIQVTPIVPAERDLPVATVVSDREVVVRDQPLMVTPGVIQEVKLVARESGSSVINGAGSSFPQAIYSRWFHEYHRLHPEAEFTYQAIGSGGGIRQVIANTIDFGATDVPMSDAQLHQAETAVLHVPTVLGALVPIYNVAGVATLRFTPEILAGIYLGKITSWDDPVIAAANPGVALPKLPICVVHRSDGSSANFIFSDYLSKVSPEWNDSVGKSTSVRWPVGLGAKGNEGVASMVRYQDGAIGYVDLIFAQQNGIAFGSIRNAAGRFVLANSASVTEAAGSVRDVPADLRISITNAPGANAYPIASYTWLLVPGAFENRAKGRELASFLRWMIVDGQGMVKELGYVPLPANITARISREIAQIR